MQEKGGKWTEKNLDKYLKSPADYAPGKFPFTRLISSEIKLTCDNKKIVKKF